MKECIFECGDPEDDTMLDVEMNVTGDGAFHAHQNHPERDHGGPLIAAERVTGSAHLRCYKRWYEAVYRSAFT